MLNDEGNMIFNPQTGHTIQLNNIGQPISPVGYSNEVTDNRFPIVEESRPNTQAA